MRKVIIFNNVTLDGVMQGPASPTEDQRDGFEYGGWAAPYGAMQSEEVGDSVSQASALLMGRETYDSFFAFWPKQPSNPMTDQLNNMEKYVASRTLTSEPEWENTTLLKGDAAQTVAELKQQDGPDLMIMGSGDLAQTLMKHNLIDRYVLLIHPIVLGTGHRIFEDNTHLGTLKLVKAAPTQNGVIVAVYEPGQSS
jgi:dihydrofolate reductase